MAPSRSAVLLLAAGAAGELDKNTTDPWWNRTLFRHPGVPMAEGSGSCDCLNWKELYDAGRIWCGEGLEFFQIPNVTGGQHDLSAWPWMKSGFGKDYLAMMMAMPATRGFFQPYHALCTAVMKKLDTNRCINFGTTPGWHERSWVSRDQWCYVPFSCRELNGGQRLLQRPVSWKRCKSGEDKLMREMAPEDIKSFANTLPDMRGALGTLFRLSYPAIHTHLWYHFKQAWRARALEYLPPIVLSALANQVPLVVESAVFPDSVRSPKKIIRNGTVWALVCMDPENAYCLQREEDFGAEDFRKTEL